MEDSLHNSGVSGGFASSMSTKNLVLVISGVFLFIALLSGLYLSTQTQNIAPKAQVSNSCVGDDKYVAGQCNPGDTPVGTVGSDPALAGEVKPEGDGSQTGETSPQLCCQRQVIQPTLVPPIVPTDIPIPTDVPPTTKPNEPTSAVPPTEAPVPPTEAPVPPTDAPACRQAPDFNVEIIINNCPGCLGSTPQ